MNLKKQILWRQKVRAYRYLYEFTKSQCDDCSKTDCACKDSICSHVQTQARLRGENFPTPGQKLRFLGCDGCVVPPHFRETCTIYLCEKAKSRVDFPKETYQRLTHLCAQIEERLLEIEEP